MPKPSAFVIKQGIKREMARQADIMFAIQQSKDMMLIAAGDALGFGPERAKRLGDAFDAVFTEYCATLVEDNKCDKDNWYTRAKIDERLKQICGEHFVPWEERYK
jgi:hypothetical protein